MTTNAELDSLRKLSADLAEALLDELGSMEELKGRGYVTPGNVALLMRAHERVGLPSLESIQRLARTAGLPVR